MTSLWAFASPYWPRHCEIFTSVCGTSGDIAVMVCACADRPEMVSANATAIVIDFMYVIVIDPGHSLRPPGGCGGGTRKTKTVLGLGHDESVNFHEFP